MLRIVNPLSHERGKSTHRHTGKHTDTGVPTEALLLADIAQHRTKLFRVATWSTLKARIIQGIFNMLTSTVSPPNHYSMRQVAPFAFRNVLRGRNQAGYRPGVQQYRSTSATAIRLRYGRGKGDLHHASGIQA